MKPDRTLLLACLAGLTAVVLHCSGPSLTGGDVTETGNARIAGRVVDSLGVGVAGVNVKLLPVHYDPVGDGALSDSLAATTGDSGSFIFTSPAEGTYNIEAIQHTTGSRALVSNIGAFGHDTVFAPVATIQKPGTIKALLPSGFDTTAAYVYLPGTTRFGRVSDNVAIIDSVPAGSFAALEYVNQADSMRSVTLKTDFTVTSALTTFISENHAWGFSRMLSINTTSSGAAVSSNIYSFPVLVRLSADNFMFSQAKSGGEDVRFVKEDGSPLPFEIERWDPVTQQAEIWVKVDTVFGNDSTHFVTMIWGDSSSTGSSNSAAVFDSTSGFTAVWHLGTDCSDATAGSHDGTNFGVTDTAGIIGGAKKFNGSSYIQVPGLLGEPQNITLGAWVHLDSTINFSQDIVSLGDAVAFRADRVVAPSGTEGFFCSNVSASDTVHVFTTTGAFISKTGWRYLTYTVDGARHVQSMYIDGIFQCSTNDINPINYSRLGTNTFLGTHGNKKTASYAFGCIDEARVCRVARSADWIKLCYMNQKQQDALVRW